MSCDCHVIAPHRQDPDTALEVWNWIQISYLLLTSRVIPTAVRNLVKRNAVIHHLIMQLNERSQTLMNGGFLMTILTRDFPMMSLMKVQPFP